MSRALTAIVIACLVAPVPVAAKLSAAEVCGAGECREITDWETLGPLLKEHFVRDSQLTSKPPVAAGWYRVTFHAGDPGAGYAETTKVLPEAGFAYAEPGGRAHVDVTDPPNRSARQGEAGRTGWTTLGRRTTRIYQEVTTGLEPLSAARLLQLGAEPPPADESGASDGAWLALAGIFMVVLGLTAARRRGLRWPPTPRSERA